MSNARPNMFELPDLQMSDPPPDAHMSSVAPDVRKPGLCKLEREVRLCYPLTIPLPHILSGADQLLQESTNKEQPALITPDTSCKHWKEKVLAKLIGVTNENTRLHK
ncbi:hypothetical protein NDU88_002188 [Pleurodeles waltl]|uniref:Uncharacterized protein n=1 Tax=Pleurodeles waltl TaxID=8319 RepID=A0AAV7M1N9_PLEWA|nr:hypothetical protein NDU88_002188 [Pleurodeles waltl]